MGPICSRKGTPLDVSYDSCQVSEKSRGPSRVFITKTDLFSDRVMSKYEQSDIDGATDRGTPERPKNALEVLFFPPWDISPSAPPVAFPTWLRPAILHAAKRIYTRLATEKEPAKARELLIRLTCDHRMRDVWDCLYAKSPNRKDMLYPARITFRPKIAEFRRRACDLRKEGGRTNDEEARFWDMHAAGLEGTNDLPSPWTDQDHAAQLFLWHVYHDTLDLKIITLVDVKDEITRILELANQMRRKAAILQVPGLRGLAPKLVKLAAECEEQASRSAPNLADDRWIMVRRSGDDELRTFIASLEITWWMFGKSGMLPEPILKLFADVANVALKREHVTSSQIREILRSWA